MCGISVNEDREFSAKCGLCIVLPRCSTYVTGSSDTKTYSLQTKRKIVFKGSTGLYQPYPLPRNDVLTTLPPDTLRVTEIFTMISTIISSREWTSHPYQPVAGINVAQINASHEPGWLLKKFEWPLWNCTLAYWIWIIINNSVETQELC